MSPESAEIMPMYPKSAQILGVILAEKLVKYQAPVLCTIFRLCVGNMQKIQAKWLKFPKSKAFKGKTLIENVNSTFDIKTGI